MSVISRRVCTFGAFVLIGGLWIGVGRSVAADSPGQLQPVPDADLAGIDGGFQARGGYGRYR